MNKYVFFVLENIKVIVKTRINDVMPVISLDDFILFANLQTELKKKIKLLIIPKVRIHLQKLNKNKYYVVGKRN